MRPLIPYLYVSRMSWIGLAQCLSAVAVLYSTATLQRGDADSHDESFPIHFRYAEIARRRNPIDQAKLAPPNAQRPRSCSQPGKEWELSGTPTRLSDAVRSCGIVKPTLSKVSTRHLRIKCSFYSQLLLC